MRTIMLLPSSPFLSRPMGPVKCLLAAVLVGLLDRGSVVADASDWLPLAVGNSWTYSHNYYDYGKDYSQWPTYTEQLGTPRFTLSVLHTEVIDGHTYFVLSDMPDFWPPVPSYFIAGKKLRWAGNHLMERTTDGEQSLFRFGGTSGASGASAVATQEGAQVKTYERHDYSTHEYGFLFDFAGGAGGASDSESYGGPAREDNSIYELGGATFLKGFGIDDCGDERGSGDAPLFINFQTAKHAVINGRTVTIREAREEAAIRTSSSDATSIEWLSWGAIKREGRERIRSVYCVRFASAGWFVPLRGSPGVRNGRGRTRLMP